MVTQIVSYLTPSSKGCTDVPAVLPQGGAFSKQQHEDARDRSSSVGYASRHIYDDHHMMCAEEEVCWGIGNEVEDCVCYHVCLQMGHRTSRMPELFIQCGYALDAHDPALLKICMSDWLIQDILLCSDSKVPKCELAVLLMHQRFAAYSELCRNHRYAL